MTNRINIFITATDTDAGKTYVAVQLTKALVNSFNKKVAVYKPIAAGCELNHQNEWQNQDALLLQTASNCDQSYQAINPIALEQAIAPHIAAQLNNTPINEAIIIDGYHKLSGDINIIEGAGGWRLPLGEGRFLSDLVKIMQPKVLLVVNMKLGCLNHAVLTYQSIISDGLECIGWIANNQENMPFLSVNITELSHLLPTPHLDTINDNGDLIRVSE